MKASGDYLTMQLCKIAAMIRGSVIVTQPGACPGIVLYYGNNGRCKIKGKNFILYF
jgi:hypothetical protein